MTADVPDYEATCVQLGTEFFTQAALIRAEIERATDHTGGVPWPSWDTVEVQP